MQSIIEKMIALKSFWRELFTDDFAQAIHHFLYLKQLPLKSVKIDRSFVLDVP